MCLTPVRQMPSTSCPRGLATIDEGLRIAAYDKARVAILTEGNNVKHLSRWVQLNFPEDVQVIDGLEQHTNKAQLLAYGRLLGKMSTTTHFVIVWDCDASSEAEDLRKELPSSAKVTPYVFTKRPGKHPRPQRHREQLR